MLLVHTLLDGSIQGIDESILPGKPRRESQLGLVCGSGRYGGCNRSSTFLGEEGTILLDFKAEIRRESELSFIGD